MYYEGDIDVPVDQESGAQWLLLAANNGWSDAMAFIASFYVKDSYVGDKLDMIVSWLEKVANNDDTDSELIYNRTLYLFGNKDFELSMVHVKPEIMSIINSIEEYLLISPIKCIELKRDLRMPNSKERRLVTFWDLLTNKESKRVLRCQSTTLRIYYSEEMLHKYVDTALYWVKKLAKNSREDAYMRLGQFYSNGKNIELDYKEAIKWFEKAYTIPGEVLRLHFNLAFYTTSEKVSRKIV